MPSELPVRLSGAGPAPPPGFASHQRAGQGAGRVLFLGLLDTVGIRPRRDAQAAPAAVALPGDMQFGDNQNEGPGAAGGHRMALGRPAPWTSGTLVRTGGLQTSVHTFIHIFIQQIVFEHLLCASYRTWDTAVKTGRAIQLQQFPR